jgi:hypothetical protein
MALKDVIQLVQAAISLADLLYRVYMDHSNKKR